MLWLLYRIMKSPSLLLVSVSNINSVSSVSRSFTYIKRFVPSTLSEVVADDTTLALLTKRTKLSTVDPSPPDNLLAEQDYCGLFSPHSVKCIDSLMPRQEAQLVAVADISQCRDIVFSGLTCSVIVTWRYDDAMLHTVYRTFCHVALSSADIVRPQFGLQFNASDGLTGLWTLCFSYC